MEVRRQLETLAGTPGGVAQVYSTDGRLLVSGGGGAMPRRSGSSPRCSASPRGLAGASRRRASRPSTAGSGWSSAEYMHDERVEPSRGRAGYGQAARRGHPDVHRRRHRRRADAGHGGGGGRGRRRPVRRGGERRAQPGRRAVRRGGGAQRVPGRVRRRRLPFRPRQDGDGPDDGDRRDGGPAQQRRRRAAAGARRVRGRRAAAVAAHHAAAAQARHGGRRPSPAAQTRQRIEVGGSDEIGRLAGGVQHDVREHLRPGRRPHRQARAVSPPTWPTSTSSSAAR